jgi:hypothetical protein
VIRTYVIQHMRPTPSAGTGKEQQRELEVWMTKYENLTLF